MTESQHTSRFPVIFLPGILMPAELRYIPLLQALGESVEPVTKELEVYATPTPPPDYSIEHEVAGISRAADAAGFASFHLYGHSGGGACALAYVATHPERVISLAVDEPATDFSAEERAEMASVLGAIRGLPPAERIGVFLQRQLASGVPVPPPRWGDTPPAWMTQRPAGVNAFMDAISHHAVAPERFRAFTRPVYFSYGSLSSDWWKRMRDRLAGLFPDFTVDLYEGASHLETSHQREPARVATALQTLWQTASLRP